MLGEQPLIVGELEAPGLHHRARRGVRVHADDASLIVTGRVATIRLVPGLQDEPAIENDPHWREAEIEPSEILKGKLSRGAGPRTARLTPGVVRNR